jgi:hypothetical protein
MTLYPGAVAGRVVVRAYRRIVVEFKDDLLYTAG